MTQSDPRASGKAAAEFDLGVLFVHGIGEQQQYSTLARFGGALQRWLRQWEEGRRDEAPYGRVAPPPVVDVSAVDPHPDGADGRKQPAHAEVAVGSDKKWLLAEAWWAPEVTRYARTTPPKGLGSTKDCPFGMALFVGLDHSVDERASLSVRRKPRRASRAQRFNVCSTAKAYARDDMSNSSAR